MISEQDVRLTVDTPDSPVIKLIAPAILRSPAGRSHVTVDELVSTYRQELEAVARQKARRSDVVRIEASDLA